MPLLSVITINYNNAKGLKQTINSVVSQTVNDVEFVVIDGGSTDNSIEYVKNEKRITNWISEADKGIYDAQNKGIQIATGEYLLFLNSGDVLVNDSVLEKISKYLIGNKSFYYGNLILKKNDVQEKHIAPRLIDMDFILNSTFWHPCVFIKSSLFKKFGLYNTQFKIAGDYEFFVRCLLKPNVTTEYMNEFITLFDGNGISNNSEYNEILKKEREEAFKINISEIVYESLKKQNIFSRSKYSKLVNLLQKIRGK